ncbi:MAG: hydrogenase, partial [Hadesarchaea archaeon]|nr:hydrogenase [Hadesarchaea archaeon]
MPLPTGKVNPYELAKLIFPHLELDDDRVVVGPDVGLDAAVIELPEKMLVLSSDPITGNLRDPGWLSVHVNANDVATIGAEPEWFLVNFFLPEGVEEERVEELAKQVSRACEELGVSVVGGHTEVTPGLGRILISGAMIGEAPKDRWVSAAGAKPGDKIILTKGVGIEGTFILAVDREKELKKALGEDLVNRAMEFREKLSVVKDALTAIKTGGVNAMHDPTEG